MTRVLCLAQASSAPRTRAKAAATAKLAAKPSSYTILERVAVREAAHAVVWAALRKHGTRQPIIDAEHTEEPIAAYVVGIDQLGADSMAAIAEILAERRSLTLEAEKDIPASAVLTKGLDRLLEQELEWILIRNLLAAALRPNGKSTRRRKARALLLIDV